MSVSTRRGMLLTLLALALPTAALANSVNFETGTFISGTATRNHSSGGLTRPNFTVSVVGSLDSMSITTSVLDIGCNVAGTGVCAFASGTLTVTAPGGGILFTDSLINGTITKFPTGAVISATFLPNSMTTNSGIVTLAVFFGNTAPITNTLTGGIGAAASLATIPEPSTMLSLGTGLIGLAGMMRYKLKLRT